MATLELAWSCHKMQRTWYFTKNKNLKNMDNDQWVLKLIIQGSFSNCICSKNLEAFFWWVIIQENLRMPCWLKINNLLGREYKNIYGWGSMFSPSLSSLSWQKRTCRLYPWVRAPMKVFHFVITITWSIYFRSCSIVATTLFSVCHGTGIQCYN